MNLTPQLTASLPPENQWLEGAKGLQKVERCKLQFQESCFLRSHPHNPGRYPWPLTNSFWRKLFLSGGLGSLGYIFPRYVGKIIDFFKDLKPQEGYPLGLPPTQDPSHHQDYYIFSGESLETFICHCYWVWGRSKVSTTMPIIIYPA